MTANQFWTMPRAMLLGCALLACASTGCQSTIGGQTLPSAFYLRDDVQYHPAGPEFRLSRQVEALEQYRLRQQAIEQGAVEAP
jgi:hypothetical protein